MVGNGLPLGFASGLAAVQFHDDFEEWLTEGEQQQLQTVFKT